VNVLLAAASDPITKSRRRKSLLHFQLIDWFDSTVVKETFRGFRLESMPLQRLLPSVGAETTTTPYEFTKHSGTMEGSGKTPYESPSHVVTMEESKIGVDEKTERFQSSNSSKTHHTMSCSSFPLCLSSPWHGMFFC
jgi:hypothetical protein